jgi:hypothetical protein
MINADLAVIHQAIDIIRDLNNRINTFVYDNYEKIVIGYDDFDRKFHLPSKAWHRNYDFNLDLHSVLDGHVTIKFFRDYGDDTGISARYEVVLKFSDLDDPTELFDRIMGQAYDQADKMMAEHFRKQEIIKAKALEEYQKYFGGENAKN